MAKVTYSLMEAETYQNRNLLVVGGGDSALEAARALSRAGTNKVTLSYRGDNFKRARERNQQFLEEAEKDGRLNVHRNSTLMEIRQDSVTLNDAIGNVELPNDYVFVLVGGESPEEFLRKTGIEIIEKVLAA